MIGMSTAVTCASALCPQQIRIVASHEDESRAVVFGIVLVSTLCSLGGILLLLGNKGNWMLSKGVETAIYIIGVTLSWVLLHTIFTYRYAHYYYGDHATQKGKNAGGLEIPGEEHPDYLDFAYFSFVIGMTFQVSDIQITSKRIRRLVLLHGLLSFVFNTVIVALTINVVGGVSAIDPLRGAGDLCNGKRLLVLILYLRGPCCRGVEVKFILGHIPVVYKIIGDQAGQELCAGCAEYVGGNEDIGVGPASPGTDRGVEPPSSGVKPGEPAQVEGNAAFAAELFDGRGLGDARAPERRQTGALCGAYLVDDHESSVDIRSAADLGFGDHE